VFEQTRVADGGHFLSLGQSKEIYFDLKMIESRADQAIRNPRPCSPRNPATAHDTPVPRPEDDFVAASAAPPAIHEIPSTAVDAANIAKPAVSQQALALATGDPASAAYGTADIDVDGH
jgi:hypothetical protein